MQCVVASASALPPTISSTVVTTVSSAIMSMAVAVQAESLPMPVCSEMGDKPNHQIVYRAWRQAITPVPEDFVRG